MSKVIITIKDAEIIIKQYVGGEVVDKTTVPCLAPNHIGVKIERPIRISPPANRMLQVGAESTEYLAGSSIPVYLLDPERFKKKSEV